MKKYKLDVECMREEGCYNILEMFSKGHHDEKEFKDFCKIISQMG